MKDEIPMASAVDLWIEIHRTRSQHGRMGGIKTIFTPPDDESKLFELLTKRLLEAAELSA